MLEEAVMEERFPNTEGLNRVFVYGIFLNIQNRMKFGMNFSRYAIVKDYATKPLAGTIVQAVPLEGYNLTGLYCHIDPKFWTQLDHLEGDYKRIKVNTSCGEAWMYVKP